MPHRIKLSFVFLVCWLLCIFPARPGSGTEMSVQKAALKKKHAVVKQTGSYLPDFIQADGQNSGSGLFNRQTDRQYSPFKSDGNDLLSFLHHTYQHFCLVQLEKLRLNNITKYPGARQDRIILLLFPKHVFW